METYTPFARLFHWLTVFLLLAQVPIGLFMVKRGHGQNIWDTLTNNLYSSHKLVGVFILFVTVVRVIYRVVKGAPGDEPTLTAIERRASHVGHWALYCLLIVVPLLGYAGVVYFPATDVFHFQLPSLPVNASEDIAQEIFKWHLWSTYILGALIFGHIGITIYHYVVRRDQVLGRMWPRFIRTGSDTKGKSRVP